VHPTKTIAGIITFRSRQELGVLNKFFVVSYASDDKGVADWSPNLQCRPFRAFNRRRPGGRTPNRTKIVTQKMAGGHGFRPSRARRGS